MTPAYALFNRQLINAADAGLPAGDIAIGRGYAAFDFFRTLGGRPVFLDDHLDRLDRSCATLRLPLNRAALVEDLRRLLDANAMAESGVRILITGGCAADGYSVAEPNVLVTQQPLAVPDDPPPVRLVTYEHGRQLPHVKHIDYLMAVHLRRWIREQGADEVLYHTAGRVTECPRSNFFLVSADGTLVTPARDVLEGITRRHVLQVARRKMEAVERDIMRDELPSAREAFITSTSRTLVPVTHVDGAPIGDGRLGSVTRSLASRFREHVQAHVAT